MLFFASNSVPAYIPTESKRIYILLVNCTSVYKEKAHDEIVRMAYAQLKNCAAIYKEKLSKKMCLK